MLRRLFSPVLLRLAAIGWSITISIGCFWPSDHLPDLDTNGDKYLHVLIFLFFASLWRLAGWSVGRVLVTGILYAGLIELVQAFAPVINRSGDWLDFAADALGLLLGLLIAQAGIRLLGLEPQSS